MKMKLHPLKFAVALSLFWTAAFRADAAISVGDLRCENLVNPQGIDAAQPRLSWMLQSTERGQKQTACEILVASSEKNLAGTGAICGAAGKFPPTNPFNFPTRANRSLSGAQCFWKVRVWDKDGKVSAWSKPALWTMGLLNSADWHDAKWIGLDGEDVTNYLAGTSWIWFPSGEPEKTAPPATNYFRRVVIIPAGRRDHAARYSNTPATTNAAAGSTGSTSARGTISRRSSGTTSPAAGIRARRIVRPHRTAIGPNKNPAGVVGLLTIEFTAGEPLVIPTDDQWKVSENREGRLEQGRF